MAALYAGNDTNEGIPTRYSSFQPWSRWIGGESSSEPPIRRTRFRHVEDEVTLTFTSVAGGEMGRAATVSAGPAYASSSDERFCRCGFGLRVDGAVGGCEGDDAIMGLEQARAQLDQR